MPTDVSGRVQAERKTTAPTQQDQHWWIFPARWSWFSRLSLALGLAGCTGTVTDEPGMGRGGTSTGSGGATPTAGTTSSAAGTASSGTSNGSGTGGIANAGASNGGASNGAGGGSSGTGPSSGGSVGVSTGGTAPVIDCSAIAPGRSPLRRLTTYEYNNTLSVLLGDTTSPGRVLPAQSDSKENLFGNDAEEQSPSSLLVEKYQTAAEDIAARATVDAAALGRLAACTSSLTTANEEACARTIATTIAPRAWRRTVTTAEVDELVALYKGVRGIATTVTFASGVGAILEGILQSPEFLYRVEHGVAVAGSTTVRRVAGREMANRLSYLFWQTMPDAALFQLADAGTLDTKEGVLSQARKMLTDPRTQATVAFFFDNLLPIPDLGALTRDPALFPTFSSAIGVAMRQEVQRLLAYEIFENTSAVGQYSAGSWPALLTSPYTFVNEALFNYYGAATFAPGVTVRGTALQKVELNSAQRLGLLTLGGITAGGTTSNRTNPVLRGSFVLNKVMCMNIELPVGLAVSPPDPYTAKTARERFSLHSASATCAGCHSLIDPMGFPFENYDAVGLYRATERYTDPNTNMVYDTPIDASGSVPGVTGTAKNGVELVRLLATSEAIGPCFSSHWMRYAYGRSIDASADACNQQSLRTAFKGAGYNIKELLVALTQTDAFLYRTAE